MPYFIGFAGLLPVGARKNYTELHNYTRLRAFLFIPNMKMIININLTPLGKVPDGTGGGGGRFTTL